MQTLEKRADFEGADILSARQFTPDGLQVAFDEASAAHEVIGNENKIDLLRGTVVVAHFEAASTRTRMSYEIGAKRLGADVIVFDDMDKSSRSKGETLKHTARTYEQEGANLIIARTKNIGDAAIMASAVKIPVHNGGDGSGEHPTQAALDTYTMYVDSGGDLSSKHLVVARDARHGRTVHSGVILATMMGMEVTVVAHPSLRLPQNIVDWCREQYGKEIRQTDDLIGVLPEADYLNPTRMQKERANGWRERRLYKRLSGLYVVSPELLDKYATPKVKVIHPLPSAGELTEDMDDDPRALYWEQMTRGVEMREGLTVLSQGKSLVDYAFEQAIELPDQRDPVAERVA